MTLCDTGPLIALIDPGQGEVHARCLAELGKIRGTLFTTWSCVTEAMHLSHRIGGWPLQRILWKLLASDAFEIHPLVKDDMARLSALMEQYQNVPMDQADASLFVAAEALGVRRIFTLDNDFRIYRFDDHGFFEVIPA